MADYTASIDTPRPPAETFAYLSDFSTTEEWDPGDDAAHRGARALTPERRGQIERGVGTTRASDRQPPSLAPA